MVIKFNVFDSKLGDNPNVSVTANGFCVTFFYPCKSSTQCTPYEVTLSRGTYKFEVWGAEGGTTTHHGVFLYDGARGGYSFGAFHAKKIQKLYIFIGGKGTDADGVYTAKPGGFNGGGFGGADGSNHAGSSGGGGGATDIRSIKDDLKSRLIVAGAGGSRSNCGRGGAEGGGLNGVDGAQCNAENKCGAGGKGGTQSSGGTVDLSRGATNGGFGYGGNGSNLLQADGGGAGGGGYFGGAGASSITDHYKPHGCGAAGGGGSGYIGGVSNFVMHDVKKGSKPGTDTFDSPYGGSEQGHRGNGACRITLLSLRFTQIKRYSPLSFHTSFVLLIYSQV